MGKPIKTNALHVVKDKL